MGATFLNVDLVITKRNAFGCLVDEFNRFGLFQLGETMEREGVWRAAFESDDPVPSSFDAADRLLGAISQLSQEGRREWDSCLERHIDVGYQSSQDPAWSSWEFEPALLARIAAVNAKLIVTIYSASDPREEDSSN